MRSKLSQSLSSEYSPVNKMIFETVIRRCDGLFFRLEYVVPSASVDPLNRRGVGDKISIASTKYHTYIKDPIVQKKKQKNVRPRASDLQ